MKNIEQLLDAISLDRVADDLWRLVNIPSPTGHERSAVLAYADMLQAAGAAVELDETNPDSPSVIGRLRGTRPGKTFQLVGHIDHIDVPHAKPERSENVISGRGSADMKNGLAGILEIIRVLEGSDAGFPGEILVTVYGMHEAPTGDSSSLNNLIERGIAGDAALVVESAHECEGKAVVAGNGQSIWNVTLRRCGDVCHELNRPPTADILLEAALRLADALRAHDQALRSRENGCPRLRPESFFVGQLHYGDFYNRAPTTCTLQGTRRWHPERNLELVQQELADLIASLPQPEGIVIESSWTFCGEAYEVDPEDVPVRALRSAYRTVTNRTMPLAGTSVVTDANRLVSLGQVPTVLCGFDCEFAHADHEIVRIKNLLEPCKVSLLTALGYLEGTGSAE